MSPGFVGSCERGSAAEEEGGVDGASPVEAPSQVAGGGTGAGTEEPLDAARDETPDQPSSDASVTGDPPESADAGVSSPAGSSWFAYVADDGSTRGRVALIDVAAADPLAQPRHLPEALADGERAMDFAFSPDGHWLAVRVGGASTDRLELFDATGWSSRGVASSLPGGVQSYAWSPDSSWLAVISRRGDTDSLSALRVASTAGESEAIEPAVAVEFPARIDSPPYVLGSGRVVAHGQQIGADPDSSVFYHSRLEPGGLRPVSAIFGSYSRSSLRVAPGPVGFFAIVRFLDFPPGVEFVFPVGEGYDFVTHDASAVLSPLRTHVALTTAPGELSLIRADETQVNGLTSTPLLAVASGCDLLLAWSDAGDRLACTTSDPDGGSIVVFDFDADAGSLALAGVVEGDYAYRRETASFRRRVLSPSGGLLAFSTGLPLFVARRTDDRYLLDRLPLLAAFASEEAELSFSPDERQLLQRQGEGLWLHGLDLERDTVNVSLSLGATPTCSEVGSSEDWCGSSASTAGVTWAPDSGAFAFRVTTPSGIETSRPRGTGPLAIGCGSSVSDYAFRP